MSRPAYKQPDSRFDLLLERVVDAPPDLVWAAWTKPDHLKQWFCPLPWTTVECEIDLRPGGIFRTVMRSPEGQDHPNDGCFLEVVDRRKLVWTSALAPGYRPRISSDIAFTAIITLEPHARGTKYTVLLVHGDELSRKKHEDMGFEKGWGTAFDQMVAVIKRM